jgi:hypothetical protein
MNYHPLWLNKSQEFKLLEDLFAAVAVVRLKIIRVPVLSLAAISPLGWKIPFSP